VAAAEAEVEYGRVISLGDARSTVMSVCGLIRGTPVGVPVHLAAHTFDQEDVTAALLDVRQKGREAYLLVGAGSHASHQTWNQAVTVVRLHGYGVKARHAEG